MKNVTAAAQTRVGIEHIGITVPDIPAATEFFEHAFGADVLYELMTPKVKEEVFDKEDLSEGLGVPRGAQITKMRMIAIGDGPLIELFEWEVDGQRPPVMPSDLGIQHMCIYVDDIHAAAARIVEAGGKALPGGPVNMFGLEGGEGNMAWYTQTPWGSTIELICHPTTMPHEETAGRMRPGIRE
jgi:catechol 2,3-dioxygenase-like lactoylglutathione lyase family enzyme